MVVVTPSPLAASGRFFGEEVACLRPVTVLDLIPNNSHDLLQVIDSYRRHSFGFGLDMPTIGRPLTTM
jgi:hypothetical protein